MPDTTKKEALPKEHQAAEKPPQNNIQDQFLNALRRERTMATIFLLGGVKLTGRIRSFDKYAVLLEVNNQEQLIFKHAISTVIARAPQAPSPASPVAEP